MGQHRFGSISRFLWRTGAVVGVVLVAVLAGDRAYAEEPTPAPVTEVAVIGDPLVLERGDVVLGPATTITGAQVLSAAFERPAELPHTGVRTSMLAGVGGALLAFGAVLVALEQGVGQPAESSATVRP